jgi:hypothetical protein
LLDAEATAESVCREKPLALSPGAQNQAYSRAQVMLSKAESRIKCPRFDGRPFRPGDREAFFMIEKNQKKSRPQSCHPSPIFVFCSGGKTATFPWLRQV